MVRLRSRSIVEPKRSGVSASARTRSPRSCSSSPGPARPTPIGDDDTDRFVSDFPSHVYFPSEIELLCVTSGFEIEQQYGDYGFVPVGRASPYLITLARRPDAVAAPSLWDAPTHRTAQR